MSVTRSIRSITGLNFTFPCVVTAWALARENAINAMKANTTRASTLCGLEAAMRPPVVLGFAGSQLRPASAIRAVATPQVKARCGAIGVRRTAEKTSASIVAAFAVHDRRKDAGGRGERAAVATIVRVGDGCRPA